MIDFRYHLVSIVAIFLALTVGIVLGSTVLEDPLIRSAQGTADSIRKENLDLRTTITQQQAREDGDNAFVSSATPELVKDQLSAERVVVLEAPGAPSGLRDQLRDVIEEAGATYTGRVSLTDKFLAADQAGVVDGLSGQLAPVGTSFPVGASPYTKAGVVLAGAIVTNTPAQASTSNTGEAVLASFQEGGFIAISDNPADRATMAVIVAPSQPFEGEQAETQNGAIVSMAGALDAAARGTVLTGNLTASQEGGVITALLDTGEEASRVSTVNTLDMPAGRVVVVYALREQLAGRSGSYGIGGGTTAFQPVISASPTPTASAG